MSDEAEVETVARAICFSRGNDPDQMAYPPMLHEHPWDKQQILIVPTADYYQPRPLWQHYTQEARAAIVALDRYRLATKTALPEAPYGFDPTWGDDPSLAEKD